MTSKKIQKKATNEPSTLLQNVPLFREDERGTPSFQRWLEEHIDKAKNLDREDAYNDALDFLLDRGEYPEDVYNAIVDLLDATTRTGEYPKCMYEILDFMSEN